MKILPRIIILAVIIFGIVRGAAADSKNSEIKIGAIASLTGPANEQGKNWLEGALLAAEELEAEGSSVRVLVEDDATVPGKVATAFQKLANIDKVSAIIGGTWDHLAQTAYPLAAKFHVPFLTPTNPVEIISTDAQTNSWIFTNGLSLKATGEAIQAFLKIKQVKTLALIYPGVPFGTMHADLLDSLAKKANIKIVYRNQFSFDGAYLDSLRLAALKAVEHKPDLAFIVLDYQGLDLVTRELQRLGSNMPILCTQHLDAAFEFSKDPARYKNSYGVYTLIKDAEFSRRFEKKYGRPPKVYAAEGYDALQFLVRAKLAQVKLGQPDATFSYQGVLGKYELSPESRAINKSEAVIMTTSNGRFEFFKP